MQKNTFLEQFPQPRRSLIANLFCYAVRGGAHTAGAVIAVVRLNVLQRLGDRFTAPEQREALEKLRGLLDTAEGREFASEILAWEALEPAEKERQKQQRRQHYQQSAMDQQAPTTAQLRYLETLGHRGVAPTSKLAASQLIDQLRQRSAA